MRDSPSTGIGILYLGGMIAAALSACVRRARPRAGLMLLALVACGGRASEGNAAAGSVTAGSTSSGGGSGTGAGLSGNGSGSGTSDNSSGASVSGSSSGSDTSGSGTGAGLSGNGSGLGTGGNSSGASVSGGNSGPGTSRASGSMATSPPGVSKGCGATAVSAVSTAFTSQRITIPACGAGPVDSDCIAPPFAPGGVSSTASAGEDFTQRDYAIKLPANYDPSTPYPVFFGGGGCGGIPPQLGGGLDIGATGAILVGL